jgi:hypothetical protein
MGKPNFKKTNKSTEKFNKIVNAAAKIFREKGYK